MTGKVGKIHHVPHGRDACATGGALSQTMHEVRQGADVFRFSFIGDAHVTVEDEAAVLAEAVDELACVGAHLIRGAESHDGRRQATFDADGIAKDLFGLEEVGALEPVDGLGLRNVLDDFEA
jgi:hypothetical protein